MGFKHVEAALQAQLPHQTGIEMGTLKTVLVAICQHADNESNYCFPSTRRLARMTHCHQSTISRAIGYLNGMGCFSHYAKGKGHGSSSFIIDLDRIQGWKIDWAKVRLEDENSDAVDISITETSDAQSITDSSDESSSDAHSIVAMHTATQRCGGPTQRCSGEPNLSFDRSAILSEESVKGGCAASSQTLNNKTESVNPVCSPVPETTPKPKRRLQTFNDYDDDGNFIQAKAAVAGAIDGLMDEL